MDNPAQESTGELNTETAADAFQALLNQDAEPPPQKAAEPESPPAEAEEPPPEPDDEPAEPAQEADPVVTVKIDGKDVEVKLSELKNGYQRQADYTRKTMEVAEQRRAAEAEQSKAQQERQAYAAELQRMQVQLEGALQQQQQTINWEQLLQSDPVEYLKQQHLAQTRQAQLNQVYARQQQVSAQMQAEAQQLHLSHLQTQQQELLAKLPEWKDEGKAKADKQALIEYLANQGYGEQTIKSIADAKDVLLARKAMLYDQLMSKAQTAAKKVATLPSKVERPGVGVNPALDKRSSAYQRLSKSGRVEDAAQVFAGLL